MAKRFLRGGPLQVCALIRHHLQRQGGAGADSLLRAKGLGQERGLGRTVEAGACRSYNEFIIHGEASPHDPACYLTSKQVAAMDALLTNW